MCASCTPPLTLTLWRNFRLFSRTTLHTRCAKHLESQTLKNVFIYLLQNLKMFDSSSNILIFFNVFSHLLHLYWLNSSVKRHCYNEVSTTLQFTVKDNTNIINNIQISLNKKQNSRTSWHITRVESKIQPTRFILNSEIKIQKRWQGSCRKLKLEGDKKLRKT